MSMPELPKITPLIAATASGVDGEANGGRWGVVKNVRHRVLFSDCSAGLFIIIFSTEVPQKNRNTQNRVNVSVNASVSGALTLWVRPQCICCEKSQCIYHREACQEIVSDEGRFT